MCVLFCFCFFNEMRLSSLSSLAHRYLKAFLAHKTERQVELSDCQPESKGKEMEEAEQILPGTEVQRPGLSREGVSKRLREGPCWDLNPGVEDNDSYNLGLYPLILSSAVSQRSKGPSPSCQLTNLNIEGSSRKRI